MAVMPVTRQTPRFEKRDIEQADTGIGAPRHTRSAACRTRRVVDCPHYGSRQPDRRAWSAWTRDVQAKARSLDPEASELRILWRMGCCLWHGRRNAPCRRMLRLCCNADTPSLPIRGRRNDRCVSARRYWPQRAVNACMHARPTHFDRAATPRSPKGRSSVGVGVGVVCESSV